MTLIQARSDIKLDVDQIHIQVTVPLVKILSFNLALGYMKDANLGPSMYKPTYTTRLLLKPISTLYT